MALRVEIIADSQGLAALAPDWATLFDAANAPTAALRHGFVAFAAQTMAPGATWCILAIRQQARLVAVWPLHVRRDGGVRIARHFGCGNNEEYAGPLVAIDIDAVAVVAAALPVLRQYADVLWAYNLPSGSAIAAATAMGGIGNSSETVRSPIIRCGGANSHADWLKTRTRNFRNAMGSARRRLAAMGQLESLLVPESDAARFCQWLFATKRQWGAARGKGGAWLFDPHAEAFFAAALGDRAATGAFGLAMTLDGQFIAGALCFDGRPIEFYVTVFDDGLAKFSPGSLIYEDLVRHAIAAGCDIDLRITWDDYKRRWATESEVRQTFVVALTARGLPTLWRHRLVLRIKAVRRWAGAQRRRWAAR